MKTVIEHKLEKGLCPTFLEVIDQSHQHAGHVHAPEGGNSHFDVVVVTDKFEGLALVERHRLVHDLLAEEFEGSLHALSIKACTPEEWQKKQCPTT